MSTATKEPKTTTVQPFGIEADSPRNSDLLLSAIPNCRLRSRIKAGRTVKDAAGDEKIPVDQSRHLGLLPEIPGMQIFLNPGKLTYRVVDPLEDDEDLCEKICKAINANSPSQFANKLRGVPEQNGTLDVHRMKTAVREFTGG